MRFGQAEHVGPNVSQAGFSNAVYYYPRIVSTTTRLNGKLIDLCIKDVLCFSS